MLGGARMVWFVSKLLHESKTTASAAPPPIPHHRSFWRSPWNHSVKRGCHILRSVIRSAFDRLRIFTDKIFRVYISLERFSGDVGASPAPRDIPSAICSTV